MSAPAALAAPTLFCEHCGKPLGSEVAWLAVLKPYDGSGSTALQHYGVRLHPQCIAPFQKRGSP